MFWSEPNTLNRPIAMMTDRYGSMCPPPMAAMRSPTTGTGGWMGAGGGGGVDGGRGGSCADRRDPGDPAQECPNRHSHDTAGKVSFEAYATEVGQHHD